jgi:hypothetical protein
MSDKAGFKGGLLLLLVTIVTVVLNCDIISSLLAILRRLSILFLFPHGRGGRNPSLEGSIVTPLSRVLFLEAIFI